MSEFRFPRLGGWRSWRLSRLRRRMDEEFAFHQKLEAARLVAEGASPAEALREAARRFGDRRRLSTLCHQAALGPGWNDTKGRKMTWTHDLRHALRALLRQPAFLLIVTLTAAVGIGATTAVFSVISSVVLNPLPYPEPERLVRIYSAQNQNPEERNYLSAPDFADYRDQSQVFAATGAFYDYRETGMDLTGQGTPQRVRALAVSAGYFQVLGATPLLGRVLTAEEELASNGRYGAPVAVLSHHLWQELSGGDPDLVGRELVLDGQAYTVVGVLRPSFLDVIQGEVDLWIPLNLDPTNRWYHRQNWYLSAVARLAPGVSLEQAQARLDNVLAAVEAELPQEREIRVRVLPLFEDVVGSAPAMLYILLGASALVLLIAAVNVANLLVARGLGRRRELAVRAALGSGRLELGRQLLFESGIAALLGGLLGVVVAYGGVRALLAVSPDSLARSEEVSFDPRLLLFALGVIALTTFLFGLAPAFQATRIDAGEALKSGSRAGDIGPAGRRWRMGLVASQVALATVLLIGAGVLLRSFAALQDVPLHFDPAGVLTFEVNLPDSRYEEPSERIAFHRRFQEKIRSLPGVEAAGAVSKLPALGPYNVWGVAYHDKQGEVQWTAAEARVVEGEYFQALHIPLLRGRLLGEEDREGQLPTMVVNQALAEAVWPGEEALGQQVMAADDERTVVGVVADVPYDHLGSVQPKFYVSHQQFGGNRNWALTQVVKVQGDPLGFLAGFRRELSTLDPELVLHRPAPFSELLGRRRATQRFALLLMAVFAGVALTLAVVGIYGVLAFTVSQQRREIGIRVALGAQPGQVLRRILGQGLVLAALGLAVGLPAAWLSGRILDSLLFQVQARDPRVFLLVAGVLAAVALVAGLAPACQALRIDPMTALREE
ncbi:MAG: ABC transporter permease [Acidobacteria bacterium]|nr:ABC transporter permease [Acidobacteriota bacterium]